MTPQELGRALAEEMRKQAIVDRDIAKTHARNAMDFQQQADNSRRLTEHFRAMADGWEQTADKLASGAITLGDAETLAEVRGALADAHEAIDPRLPFAQQRKQLAAANEAAVFTAGQLAGTDCGDCGGTIRGTSGGMVVGETTHGPLYEHINAEDCNRHVATEAVKSDAYAAGYRDALDDDARLAEAADFAAAAEPGIEADL